MPDDAVELGLSICYPPATLVQFCLDHVRRTYHPRAKLTAQWHPLTESGVSGYESPARPTADQEYLVTVDAARKSYSYRVRGTAEVVLHSVRESSRSTSLPIPDLLPPLDIEIPRPEDDPD